jgi:hypothetical protein
MTNEGLLDLSWRWFPKTALFVSVQQAAIHYFDNAQSGRNSYPLRIKAGIRGLITEKVSAGLSAGYSEAFYSNSVNPTGFGQISAHADATYRATPLTSLSLGYEHDFQNSIIGNYYNVDVVHLALRHSVAERLIGSAFGHYENRRFDSSAQSNPLSMVSGNSRVDNYLSAGVALDHYFTDWAYGGVGYNVFNNDSNASYVDQLGRQVSAGYLKQQVFVRLGVTY